MGFWLGWCFLLGCGILEGGERLPPTVGEGWLTREGLPLYQSEVLVPRRVSLNGPWLVKRVSGQQRFSLMARTPEVVRRLQEELPGCTERDYEPSGWQSLPVPSVLNPPPDRYQGIAWYRRSFTLPRAEKGTRWLLHFEAVNYVADVWVNGRYVGWHEGGYTPFTFDITEALRSGENVVVVRVDNPEWGKGFDTVPYKVCDWWNYGGIVRDVALVPRPPVHLAGGVGEFSPEGDSLTVRAWVRNASPEAARGVLEASLYPLRMEAKNRASPLVAALAEEGRPLRVRLRPALGWTFPPGKTVMVETQLTLLDPLQSWSPESPNLYALRLRLLPRPRQVGDELWLQVGYRKLEVGPTPPYLFLNGLPLRLAGANRHEELPEVYRATTWEDGERLWPDLERLKALGANFLRLAHYPNHPLLPMLCDRIGLALWEEIPVYWFDGSALLRALEQGIGQQMWLEMLYRDASRPSILFWGACNECSGQEERARFLRRLRELAAQYGGPRLMGQSAVGLHPTDPTQRECDVVGFTFYYGVFYGKDAEADTWAALEQAAHAFPGRPILVTEFGYWAHPQGTEGEKQARIAEATLRALTRHPAVAGMAWWCAYDYHTFHTRINTMGLWTFDRATRRPVAEVLARAWAAWRHLPFPAP